MAYGARAYITYVNIKKEKEKADGQHHQQSSNGNSASATTEDAYSGGLRAYQSQSHGTTGNLTGINGGGPGFGVVGATSNGAYHSDDGSELRQSEADSVTALFGRDRAGRVRLGMLPG